MKNWLRWIFGGPRRLAALELRVTMLQAELAEFGIAAHAAITSADRAQQELGKLKYAITPKQKEIGRAQRWSDVQKFTAVE